MKTQTIIDAARRALPVAACLVALAAGGAILEAQEEGEPERLDSEPGTLDPLMEQSSEGNTVQNAQFLYHQGKRDLKRADDLAAKAAETSDDPDKAAKLLDKSTQARESAVQQLTQALRQNPKLIDAYDALGMAYRSMGKFQEALQIHGIALNRDPDSLDNFRGWSQALLSLDMLGDATAAYTSYSEAGSPRAPILMEEIKKWLAAKQADPGELDPAHVQRMADWVAQQGG
jgi:tetratricopeptide (TPR) repeat protein